MQIPVKYNIGDMVITNDGTECRVIGYKYVETGGLQYIILYRDDRKYVYDIEITKHKDIQLGFITCN